MTLVFIKLSDVEAMAPSSKSLGGQILPGWNLPPGTERSELIRQARREWAEAMTPAPEEVIYGENSGVAE